MFLIISEIYLFLFRTHVKYVIDGSEYRQKWFDFRRIQLERLVTDYLNSLDIDALAE